MGWCDDINSRDKYNKLVNLKSEDKAEKLFRSDYKYDYFIPIKYNWKNPKIGKGSAIFLHLTKTTNLRQDVLAYQKKIF